MRPIASLVFGLGIATLFLLNRDRQSRTSQALWLPVLWMSLAASRAVSVWLQITPAASVDQYMDGSPLDRAILTSFLAIGLIVLLGRRSQVGQLLSANGPLLVFFAYCAVSVFWSDYPDVAFKRWIKSLGDIVMLMVVLTDADPASAIKRLFSRTAFLLLPLSVLFVKYYPDLGRYYDRWEGTQFFSGVSTDKNMLGMGCMVFGLVSFWRLYNDYWHAETPRKTGFIIANSSALVMALWLLWKCNSMTSIACFTLASGLIVASGSAILGRRRSLIHVLVVTVLAIAFSVLFLHIGGGLLKTVGRDPTLTGRTELWERILNMAVNPLIGAGFESFWLGDRLDRLWNLYWWHPNESHNGYIEIYLNLGWIGLSLLAIVIVTSYRNIMWTLSTNPPMGRLRLALFIIGIAYNFTEAAFKTMHLIWIAFLLALIAPAKPSVDTPARDLLDPLSSSITLEHEEVV